MSSLIPFMHRRNTQDEWIGPSFSYFCDGELLKSRPGSFSEDLLVLRRRIFCRDSNKVESNVTAKVLARNTRSNRA